MQTIRTTKFISFIGALGLLAANSAWAQTFSSGSTGALGALNPTSDTTITLPADGVLNYTTINIPSGVTVTFALPASGENPPATMLATGDVTINGTIRVNGTDGAPGSNAGTTIVLGSSGGPGGFRGGDGSLFTSSFATNFSPTPGQGPGGGGAGSFGCGFSSCGGSGGTGSYGASSSFVSLIPLFGGSGGGGCCSGISGSGPSGAGGGGAILIASSSKITVNGAITANSGAAASAGAGSSVVFGGLGSAGAIRLVAPQFAGTGLIQANLFNQGHIRVETYSSTFTGTINPFVSGSLVTTLGPVTSASTPALVALPTLAITSISGLAAPGTPAASYNQADMSLPIGTTNPVPVVVTATNTPTNAILTVAVLPRPTSVGSFGSGTKSTFSASLSGTFSSSTATANVTLPAGEVSVVQAWATMTLTGQIVSLLPLIDGEPVERVQVAAVQGERSTLSFVTKSGKEVRVDRLAVEDQLRIARAWEVLRATRLE